MTQQSRSSDPTPPSRLFLLGQNQLFQNLIMTANIFSPFFPLKIHNPDFEQETYSEHSMQAKHTYYWPFRSVSYQIYSDSIYISTHEISNAPHCQLQSIHLYNNNRVSRCYVYFPYISSFVRGKQSTYKFFFTACRSHACSLHSKQPFPWGPAAMADHCTLLASL